jgi:hypothetical protein
LFLSFWYLAFRCVLQLVLFRPRSTEFKELEIVVLRHQLAVLRRQADCPQLTNTDRALIERRDRLGGLIHEHRAAAGTEFAYTTARGRSAAGRLAQPLRLLAGAAEAAPSPGQPVGRRPKNRRTTSSVLPSGCFEGGATVRAARRPLAGLGVQLGPLAGLCGMLLLLAVLARTVGLVGAGWLVGLASGLALNAALARALWRDPSARLGPAGWVTLVRATLAVGVAALTAASFERNVAVATLGTPRLRWSRSTLLPTPCTRDRLPARRPSLSSELLPLAPEFQMASATR